LSKENTNISLAGGYLHVTGLIRCKECIKVTCELQVASYRIPRYIRFTNEFAWAGTTGKIQKTELLAKILSEIHNTNSAS
jgi:hypothetical protein